MSSLLRTSKLIEKVTSSLSYDKQIQSGCSAFDYQMYQIIDETGQVCFIPNIMGLTDSKLVDILAWQFHVDFYDATRDLEFRKNLVQQSIIWHKTKGTYQLVKDVLDTYWPGGASLLEWYNYYIPLPPPLSPTVPPAIPYPSINSPPIVAPPTPSWHDRYRFRVYIDETIIDPADEAAVLLLIEHYKPVSRWCEGIFRATNSDCSIGWCGMVLAFIYHFSDQPTNYP